MSITFKFFNNNNNPMNSCSLRNIVDNQVSTLISIIALIYILLKTNSKHRILYGLLYILASNIIIGYALMCSNSATLYIRAMIYNTKILGGALLLLLMYITIK